jgi:hypothetical protein
MVLLRFFTLRRRFTIPDSWATLKRGDGPTDMTARAEQAFAKKFFISHATAGEVVRKPI